MPVEFDTDSQSPAAYNAFQAETKQPTFVRWIISANIAKTAKQANAILIAVSIIILIVAGFVYYRGTGGSAASTSGIRIPQ